MDEEWLIMEKEYDIAMKRLFMEAKYMTEDEDKKESVITRIIEKMRKMLWAVIDKVKELFGGKKAPSIPKELEEEPVELTFDPQKSLDGHMKNLEKIKKAALAGGAVVGSLIAIKVVGSTLSAVKTARIYDKYSDVIESQQRELDELDKRIGSHVQNKLDPGTSQEAYNAWYKELVALRNEYWELSVKQAKLTQDKKLIKASEEGLAVARTMKGLL